MKRKNKQNEREKGKERKKERKTHLSTLKEVKFFCIKREILSLEVNTAKLEAF